MNISYNCAMSYESHMPVLAMLSREESGVFTAAQAVRSGVPRDAISYALRTGKLERVVRGAYRLSSTAPSELDLAVALWKLTDPSAYSRERLSSRDGVVVGGRTAAAAWMIGDLHPYPCRIYAPERLRSRVPSVSFAQRRIDPNDTVFSSGMMVARPERVILDLALDGEDPSLVADALADARRRLTGTGEFDTGRLRELFESSSGRWGRTPYSLDAIMPEE